MIYDWLRRAWPAQVKSLFSWRQWWNSPNFYDHSTQKNPFIFKVCFTSCYENSWMRRPDTGGLILSVVSHSDSVHSCKVTPFYLIYEQNLLSVSGNSFKKAHWAHTNVYWRDTHSCLGEYFIIISSLMAIPSDVWAQVDVGLSHGPIREIKGPKMIHWLTIDITLEKTLEQWGQNSSFREGGMRKKRSGASDYWEDKGPAVRPLTAASTSGVPPHVPPLWASHPIPSTRGNFLHSSITHLSLHSSLFTPTNGKNNTQ